MRHGHNKPESFTEWLFMWRAKWMQRNHCHTAMTKQHIHFSRPVFNNGLYWSMYRMLYCMMFIFIYKAELCRLSGCPIQNPMKMYRKVFCEETKNNTFYFISVQSVGFMFIVCVRVAVSDHWSIRAEHTNEKQINIKYREKTPIDSVSPRNVETICTVDARFVHVLNIYVYHHLTNH